MVAISSASSLLVEMNNLTFEAHHYHDAVQEWTDVSKQPGPRAPEECLVVMEVAGEYFILPSADERVPVQLRLNGDTAEIVNVDNAVLELARQVSARFDDASIAKCKGDDVEPPFICFVYSDNEADGHSCDQLLAHLREHCPKRVIAGSLVIQQEDKDKKNPVKVLQTWQNLLVHDGELEYSDEDDCCISNAQARAAPPPPLPPRAPMGIANTDKQKRRIRRRCLAHIKSMLDFRHPQVPDWDTRDYMPGSVEFRYVRADNPNAKESYEVHVTGACLCGWWMWMQSRPRPVLPFMLTGRPAEDPWNRTSFPSLVEWRSRAEFAEVALPRLLTPPDGWVLTAINYTDNDEADSCDCEEEDEDDYEIFNDIDPAEQDRRACMKFLGEVDSDCDV